MATKIEHITLRLTVKEADQLFGVALNGFGDGDYYQDCYNGKERAAFLRAMVKLAEALNLLWRP